MVTPLPRALAQLSFSLAAGGASAPAPWPPWGVEAACHHRRRASPPSSMPTRTSSFRPRAPALPWLPPAGAEPLRRAAVASCLCQSRCRGSRDGAPSTGAEPVWRRCEVQPLRDGGAEPVHSGGLARSSCCSCAMAARGTRSSCLWRPGRGMGLAAVRGVPGDGKRNSCSGDGNHRETERTDKRLSVRFF